MFYYRWNSWVVEILGGIALASLMQVIPGAGRQLFACTGASVWYETTIDVNGWSLKDVSQRQVGILAGLILWQFIR